MIAANVMRGDVALADWSGLSSTTALILDVRDPVEFEQGAIEGATNIPPSRQLHHSRARRTFAGHANRAAFGIHHSR
jgi:rhodanese-related sulfurtransferase